MDNENVETTVGGEESEQQAPSSVEQISNKGTEGEQTVFQQVTETGKEKEDSKESLASSQKRESTEDVPKKDSYGFDDIFPMDLSMEDGEKEIISDLLKKFNGIGITRQQATEVFQELKNYAKSKDDAAALDTEKIYAMEMKKLGDEKDAILSSLKSFSDTMVANRIWDDGKKQSFYDTITTADTARMFYDVIANGNLARSGNFSHASVNPSQAPQFSREEQVDMYKRAFQMAKANPMEGDLEIKRLDRLFGIK
jgi:hypothetical protein